MLLDIVKKGSVDRSVTIRIIDSGDGTPETGVEHNSSGIDLWYRRESAAKTSITEAALSALTDAHSDGGIEHIGDGYYRLDLPDAAFATGVNHVDVGGTVTGMIVIGGRVRLVNYDPEDTVRLGLTALPNAAAEAAGGLYTRGTGAGQINQAANGMIDTNPVRLNNVAQSLLDLKDFADDGYDPSTNKVAGVVLADTLTTYTGNTPQTGDSYAIVNSGTHGNAALLARTPSATSIGNMNIVFATDFATNYNTTSDGWVVKLGDYAHGGASATLDIAGGDIAISTLDIDNTVAVGGNLSVGGTTTLTGAVTAANASNDVRGIKLHASGVDGVTLPANLITNTSIAADAITAAKVAPDVHQETIELAFTYDATANYAGAAAGSLVKEIADNAGGSSLTAADIADAVWEEALGDHSGTAGSTAEALDAAGTAGDPWITALPGAYGAGSAGKIIGDNLNATVSSRSSHSASDVWAVGTRRLTDATNITSTGGTITVTSGGVTLANGVTHGGTTAVFRMERIIVTAASGTDRTAVTITGDGTGAGFAVSGGSDGTGVTFTGGINAGYGLQIISFAQEPIIVNDWTGAGTGCIRLISNSAQGIIDGKISGIVGTIATLDALDTAQDSQHATTQGLVTTVDAVVDAILADTGTDGVVVASGSKTGYTLAASHDIYHADISLCIDATNSRDEYGARWFKNGVRVTSGITSPLIQAVKRADGTDLIAETAMTQVGSTGAYKYDATTTARTTAGEAVLVTVKATIDGSQRLWDKWVSRDSTS